jgi:putative tricarboxylic transport membrane protein
MWVVTAFMLVFPLIRIWRKRSRQRRALADV